MGLLNSVLLIVSAKVKVLSDKKTLNKLVSSAKNLGKSIGFVPTMGALHQGHLSLLKQCNKENDISVVSIFVNPTQFNEKSDFNRYPRFVDKDIEALSNIGYDFIYMPEVEDLYPDQKFDLIKIDLLHLDSILEGAKRPGHFDGVVTIVKKLFDIIQPDKAYFGQKDFQQCMVIQRIVDFYKMNIEIVKCPIIREFDGLAMSSRNMLLSEKERKLAPVIYDTLIKAKDLLKSKSVIEVKIWAKSRLDKEELISFEYFEIANAKNLIPIKEISEVKNTVICTALRLGQIRLIDNIVFN